MNWTEINTIYEAEGFKNSDLATLLSYKAELEKNSSGNTISARRCLILLKKFNQKQVEKLHRKK